MNSMDAPTRAAPASQARLSRHGWPAHRAVAWLPGSLPMGGTVPDTPIHAFEQPAPALALAAPGSTTRLLAHDGTHVDVTPTKGSALFFRHGFGPGSVPHVGCRVIGPVPKYVARINVMYEARSQPGP